VLGLRRAPPRPAINKSLKKKKKDRRRFLFDGPGEVHPEDRLVEQPRRDSNSKLFRKSQSRIEKWYRGNCPVKHAK
jgi:hypothetical protein